jgi:hypothetical protein
MVRAELESLLGHGLILNDDLHICYFLTPVREVGNCDWAAYRDLLARLSEPRQRIAHMLGVDEYLVDQCAMGIDAGRHAVSGEERRVLFTTRRFFVAMILSDLLSECPMHHVENKYKINRGQAQTLLKSASMFSSSMTSFCNAMGWFSLEAVMASFVKRLGFGVKPDILPLMEIKGMTAGRARAIWTAGLRDPASVAACSPQQLVDSVKRANSKDNKSAKFFSMRSAVSVVREASRAVQSCIRQKRGELLDLSMRSTPGGLHAPN